MDSLPIASTTLRWLAGATIIFQLGLMAAVPLPSPVATRRVWARRGGDEFFSGNMGPNDPVTARLLPVAALVGLLAVIAAIIWPGGVGTLILPMGARFPGWLAPAGGLCLLAGNALIGSAVWALKRHTRFDAVGQSRQLVTGGVFALIQHPIVIGAGMIYLGFFLILPGPLVLAGLGCYGWHQKRRLASEEIFLAEKFGPSYQNYRRRVGRFWPRWSDGAGSA
jgi:protein-S-isoprenylcysteine O-methyltransferase Ste14